MIATIALALTIHVFSGVLMLDNYLDERWKVEPVGTYIMEIFGHSLFRVDKRHRTMLVRRLPPGTVIIEDHPLRMEANSPIPGPTHWTVLADGVTVEGVPANNGIWYGDPGKGGDGRPHFERFRLDRK